MDEHDALKRWTIHAAVPPVNPKGREHLEKFGHM
jgi:hypothetical protein